MQVVKLSLKNHYRTEFLTFASGATQARAFPPHGSSFPVRPFAIFLFPPSYPPCLLPKIEDFQYQSPVDSKNEETDAKKNLHVLFSAACIFLFRRSAGVRPPFKKSKN